MIFVVAIPAILANIRYRWLAGGALGGIQSSGITQVGSFPLFRLDVGNVPTGAEELIVYDVTDPTNFSLARYGTSAAVWEVLASDHENTGTTGKVLSEAGAAGDPLSVVVPGSYADHTVGKLISLLDIAIPSEPVLVIPAPDAPNQSVGYLTTRDEVGELAAGVVVTFQLLSAPAADSYRTAFFSATSDANGALSLSFRKDAIYRARRGGVRDWVQFTVPSSGTSFALPQVLGAP